MFKNVICLIGISAALSATGMGCNSATPPPAATPAQCTNCSAITPENFVAALVSLAQSGQIAAGYSGSKVVKDPALQNGWFVIWDGATQSYMAVDVAEPDLGGYCSQNETVCSNLNPQAAALTFVTDGNKPVYEAQSVASGSGSVSGTNGGGTYFYGSYSGSSSTVVAVGSYTSGYYGSESVQPNQPLTSASEYSGGGLPVYPVSGQPGYNTVTAYSVKPTGQNDASGAAIYTDTYGEGMLFSQGSQTRDTDLQQANLQRAGLVQRAAMVSANFQMDFGKAVQLTTLADKLNAIQSAGQSLSDGDRSAVLQTLNGIAGTTQEQLSKAVIQSLQGNSQPAQELVETISKNLGMPSSASLKNQILPQLGLDLN
jgi:hypothetical protein